MEETKHKGLLQRTATAFALPGDVVAGLTCVHLVGREEVHLQNHRGIASYAPGEIVISGCHQLVRIRGTELVLRSMTPTDLMITGTITAVELE